MNERLEKILRVIAIMTIWALLTMIFALVFQEQIFWLGDWLKQRLFFARSVLVLAGVLNPLKVLA